MPLVVVLPVLSWQSQAVISLAPHHARDHWVHHCQWSMLLRDSMQLPVSPPFTSCLLQVPQRPVLNGIEEPVPFMHGEIMRLPAQSPRYETVFEGADVHSDLILIPVCFGDTAHTTTRAHRQRCRDQSAPLPCLERLRHVWSDPHHILQCAKQI